MSQQDKDFISSWQFRTLMAGACIAAVGAVACALGGYFNYEVVCTVGLIHAYVGDAMGAFGVGAIVLTLAWNSIQGTRGRDR